MLEFSAVFVFHFTVVSSNKLTSTGLQLIRTFKEIIKEISLIAELVTDFYWMIIERVWSHLTNNLLEYPVGHLTFTIIIFHELLVLTVFPPFIEIFFMVQFPNLYMHIHLLLVYSAILVPILNPSYLYSFAIYLIIMDKLCNFEAPFVHRTPDVHTSVALNLSLKK